jgi:hypothetical protein
MKKIITAVMILACVAHGQAAVTVRPGVFFGPQRINDQKIRSVYGGESVFLPYLEAQVWKGLTVGLGYEFGYSREGKIGLYADPSSLRMSGLDVFIGYELRQKKFAVFVKTGLGSYAYRQTVNNPYVSGYKVDHTKSTIPLAGGLKIYPHKLFFMAAEVRYVPLKVKPYDYEVDLGGFRFMAGLGLSLDLIR